MENSYPNQDNYDHQVNTSVATSSSFFSKVIFFFGLALLVSAAGVYTSFEYILPRIALNPQIIWFAYVLELILVFTSRMWSTRHPLNYLIFTSFAFLTGITVAPLMASVILEFGGPMLIIKSLLATTLAFAAAATYGSVTNRTLLGWRGFLMISLIGMIVMSIIGFFFPWSNNFEIIFSGFGVAVFVAFTMYDFQKLKSFPPDRYIDAALEVYLDIFNLFIYILRLISGTSRD